MSGKKIESVIKKYVDPSKGSLEQEVIENCELSLLQIRDRIALLGNIIEEDLENQIYVYTVNKGASAFANAVVAVRKEDNSLIVEAYAEEGLIKQNIAGKNIIKLKKALSGEKGIFSPRKGINIRLLILIIVPVLVTSFLVSNGIKKKTRNRFANLTANYNTVAEAYNASVKEISIANISNLPETVDYKPTDYDVKLVKRADVKELTTELAQLMNDYKVIVRLEEPTEEWVIERISTIEEISDIGTVTPENNPDGLLGKVGGYYSCIYFSLKGIDQNSIPGVGVVGKGTDAGGAIELYSTLKAAMNRCQYLGQFDNTLLYSGSYTVLGKMVIRTSYKLSNEEQIRVTGMIAETIVDGE